MSDDRQPAMRTLTPDVAMRLHAIGSRLRRSLALPDDDDMMAEIEALLELLASRECKH